MTKNEILKETRSLCRNQDCVLRTHKSCYINSSAAYYIAERSTNRILISHMTLSSAYERSLDDSIHQALALN